MISSHSEGQGGGNPWRIKVEVASSKLLFFPPILSRSDIPY